MLIPITLCLVSTVLPLLFTFVIFVMFDQSKVGTCIMDRFYWHFLLRRLCTYIPIQFVIGYNCIGVDWKAIRVMGGLH